MAELIPNQNLNAMFGANLGSGLGQGLQMLAQHKLGEMYRKKNVDLFKRALSVDDSTAELLTQLQEQNPQGFHNILGMIGGGSPSGQDQQMSPQLIDQQQSISDQQDIGPQSQQSQSSLNRLITGKAQGESKEDVKRDIAEQQRLEPFIKGQYEDFNMAKKLRAKAENMLDILKKNKDIWPGFIGGKLPDSFHRNPAVRKYLADANTLVTLLANSRKGQPTNAKIRFEQLSKPNLDQPYETQKALLEDIIKDSDLVFDTQKNLEKIRKQYNGKYPSDIRQRIIEGGLEAISGGENKPEQQGLPDASKFPIGKKLMKDGVTIVNTPNGWERVQ